MSDLIRLSRISAISRRVSPHSSNWPSRRRLSIKSLTSPSSRAGVGSERRSAGAFDGIGNHQDGSLLGLRLRARVAVSVFRDRRSIGIGAVAPIGLVIEKLDQRRPVVLLDQIDDRLGQIVLAAQVNTVLDVADDDQRAHRGGQLGVPASRANLVLDKVVRFEHLADVVKISSDADQKGIGPDAFGR